MLAGVEILWEHKEGGLCRPCCPQSLCEPSEGRKEEPSSFTHWLGSWMFFPSRFMCMLLSLFTSSCSGEVLAKIPPIHIIKSK